MKEYGYSTITYLIIVTFRQSLSSPVRGAVRSCQHERETRDPIGLSPIFSKPSVYSVGTVPVESW